MNFVLDVNCKTIQTDTDSFASIFAKLVGLWYTSPANKFHFHLRSLVVTCEPTVLVLESLNLSKFLLDKRSHIFFMKKKSLSKYLTHLPI